MTGRKIPATLLVIAALCLLLTSCAVSRTESVSFFAMDTFMTLTVTGKDAPAALSQAKARILELERQLSVSDAESDIARLNANGAGEVSGETAELLGECLALSESCGGLFDVTAGSAVEAWGFLSGDYRVPEGEELAALRAGMGYGRVEIDGCTVRLGQGQRLDLGAIGKGYASREVCALLRDRGIESALVVLGGSVEAIGSKPSGESWRIGVQHPDENDAYLGIYELADGCMVTSGDYQRYFEHDGIRYCHIIDPRTAMSAVTDLRSCTVICDDACKADAYSTALFIMGSEGALDFWAQRKDFELILYTADGRLLLTPGLREGFSSSLPTEVMDDA